MKLLQPHVGYIRWRERGIVGWDAGCVKFVKRALAKKRGMDGVSAVVNEFDD